jgi:hypothetical protein
MRPEPRPELSLILVTDRYAAIRDVVRWLGRQTVRDRLELVIVTGSAAELEHRGDLSAFAAVEVVTVGAEELLAVHPARLAGIRAAHAPIVIFGETHSFPEPDYCAALLAAFRDQPWAAVGPGMLAANPQSAIGWSALLLDYGAWLAGGVAEPRPHVAGHNGAYRREVLLAYGDELAALMQADTLLTARMHSDGHRFYFQPAARTLHLNVSRPGPWLVERFAGGREFAAARVKNASLLRRLLFVAGSPLVPAIRLVRIAHQVARIEASHRPGARVLPALLLALAVSALGELCGYAFGSSPWAARRLAEIEVHRSRFVAGGWRSRLGLEET